MSSGDDFRDYVNPHPSCSEQAQRQAIGPGGELYVEDRTGQIIAALIRSVRKGALVRVMWLFNLAPSQGTPTTKRRAVVAHVTAIHSRGGSVLEMATGLHSDKHLAAMVMKAAEMIGNHGRGAAGRSKPGRPKFVPPPQEREIMKFEWFSRKNKTIDAVLDVLAKKHDIETNKNVLYRLFGPRG